MKKKSIILFLIVLLFFLISFLVKQNVGFVLLNTYSKTKIDFRGDVKLINDIEKLEELYELSGSDYNINIDSSTVILSKKKIKKIKLIQKYKLFPVFTHFIEIYCENDKKENNIYIYYLPNNKVYFDERNNLENQIVCW